MSNSPKRAPSNGRIQPPRPDQRRERVEQFSQFWANTRQSARESIDWFANFLFDTTVSSGRFRRWLFIFLAAAFWSITAFVSNPPTGQENFFIYPLQTLFHPRVLRHVLVAALTFWIALKVSAIYLDDVFELENPEITERYILQASLANRYPQIEIKDGEVQNSAESTIVRLGGPGLVRVHYDSAALFEKSNGDPTVIIAEDGLVALDRFERLRKVVRLRDHIDETDIATRTRDGIPVSAKGVRIKYYIRRHTKLPQAEKIPYPVLREAVEKMAYSERVYQRLNPLASSPPPVSRHPEYREQHPETLDISPGPITSELRRFINHATLSEFLAAISEPELNQINEDSRQLDEDARSLSGEIEVGSTDYPQPSTIPPDFRPRSAITKQIYQNFKEQSRMDTGLELEWIDIGTWVLPDQAKEIITQHEDAWRQSLENLKTRSAGALAGSENESKIKATRVLLLELIYEFRTLEETAEAPEIINALLSQYLQKLGLALEIYQKQARAAQKPPPSSTLEQLGLVDVPPANPEANGSPRQISKAITHLSTLLKQINTVHKS
ncbi:MAG: hypothetical protein ABFS17_12590 [Chloroflexota bacterium]